MPAIKRQQRREYLLKIIRPAYKAALTAAKRAYPYRGEEQYARERARQEIEAQPFYRSILEELQSMRLDTELDLV